MTSSVHIDDVPRIGASSNMARINNLTRTRGCKTARAVHASQNTSVHARYGSINRTLAKHE
jgi:hypothetical protein